MLLALFGATLGLGGSWQRGEGCRFVDLRPIEIAAESASLSAVAAKVGFRARSADQTGIAFSNALPVRLMMENNNLMNGSGVAAGDYDGDGACDLYFCAIDGTNALYRNLGRWRFGEVTRTAGVGCPGLRSTGATFADVDGDGNLDLLVATLGHGVHCFVNQGGGRFRENTTEVGLAADTGSTTLALADVDGDGDLDLYVANYGSLSILRSGGRAQLNLVNGRWTVTGPYARRLRVVEGRLEEVGEPDVLYLNDGAGRFRPVPWNSDAFLDEEGKPKPEPWDFGLTAQMRDLNGDRAPDIYVCNDFQTVDRVWLNDGKGHFRAPPRVAMRKQSFSSMGVDFADVDRDGFLDFCATEMRGSQHSRRMREVVGMQPFVSMPGWIENRPEVARNTLHRNRGDGTYAEIGNYSQVAATDWSWQPAFLDVDLDGFEDLLIVNGIPFDVQDRDTLNRVRALGRQTPEQSRTNLALYPPLLTSNVAFRNRHDLTFADASHEWGFDSRQISQGLAMADLDDDGDLDLAINGLNASPLLYENLVTRPRVAVRLKGKQGNPHGIGATVRVQGGPVPMQMQEILCGGRYLSGDDPLRVFAAGNLTNELTLEVLWRSGKTSLVPGAKPNRLYVVEEPDETGESPPGPAALGSSQPTQAGSITPLFQEPSGLLQHVHHEVFFSDYALQPLLMKQLSQLGPGVAWFDLDEDGHDELIVGAGKGGRVEIFRRTSGGSFENLPHRLPWPAPGDVCGLAGWVNGDGHRAILAAISDYESRAPDQPAVVRVSLEREPLAVTVASVAEISTSASSVGPLAVADVEGDGDLDLLVGGRVMRGAYPKPATSRLYRQTEGQLVLDSVKAQALESVGLVSSALWTDLTADGFPELVLACEWGPIRIFHNERGKLREITEALGLASLTGWWNGLASADLDEDGRLDLIASNWGLNTGYEASPEHPSILYYGDLSGGGLTDLIEAYWAPDIGAMMPRRTLNALGQAFPVLLGLFPTHHAFGTATVAEVLGALQVPPQVLSATALTSMAFLNRGTTFQAVPLPAEAQFAPAFSVNVADADGDGHEDVFLSQNFFGMRPEWERLDGGRGLWLLGDGTGRLAPLPGQASGVRVYGEQRGAAVGDFDEDGRIDQVVTQNGATTRLFRNLRARPGLRVRLRGPVGNPDGIGAVLRLRFGEHIGPAREVHAGSGYWSQDSVVQVLGMPTRAAGLTVRWPGGREIQAALPQPAKEIEVDHRGRVRLIR